MIALTKVLILLMFLAGITLLQIFLSKRENKWFGLIMPGIGLLFSLMAVLGMFIYENQPIIQTIMQLILVFLLYNIPTSILFVIYLACREKFKKKKEIDKMNIQDLE